MAWLFMTLLGFSGGVQDEQSREKYDSIVTRNIFSPPKPEKPAEAKEKKKEKLPKEKKKPVSWNITGVFFYENESSWKWIVEKDGEGVRIVTVGDQVDEATVLSAEEERIVFQMKDGNIERAVGGSLPARAEKSEPEEKASPPTQEPEEPVEEKVLDRSVLDRLKKKYKKKPLPETSDDE